MTDTYPKHPMSKNKPEIKTQTELIDYRRAQERDDIRAKKNAKDAEVAKIQKATFKDYYQPQEYVENPRYTATWQKVEEERRNKRKERSLNEINIDINPEKLPDPTIKWVEKPSVYARSLLVEKRKKDNLDDQ